MTTFYNCCGAFACLALIVPFAVGFGQMLPL